MKSATSGCIPNIIDPSVLKHHMGWVRAIIEVNFILRNLKLAESEILLTQNRIKVTTKSTNFEQSNNIAIVILAKKFQSFNPTN